MKHSILFTLFVGHLLVVNPSAFATGGSNSGGADEPTRLEASFTKNANELVAQLIPMIRLQSATSPELALEQYESLLKKINASVTTNQKGSWLFQHTFAAISLNEKLIQFDANSDLRAESMDHALVSIDQNALNKKASYAVKELTYVESKLFIGTSETPALTNNIQNAVLEILGGETASTLGENSEIGKRIINLKNIESAEKLKKEIDSLINTLSQEG